MKYLFTIFTFLLCPLILFSQDRSPIDGNWNGFIEMNGSEVDVTLTFSTMDGQTDGAINIPMQASFDLPVEVPLIAQDSLVFSYETGNGPATFRATIDEESPVQISGLYRLEDTDYPFMLIKEDPDAPAEFGPHTEKEEIIPAGLHRIAGSIVTPDSARDSTLVILNSGSGSQERNANIAGFEMFKELSMELANRGYFSFRYDDRGTGKSTGTPDATLQELADDLVYISRYFSNHDQYSFDSVVYLGHSQGGIISLLAAQDFSPRQIVLLSSPALPGSDIIIQQIRLLSEARDIPEEVVEENIEFQQQVYQAARADTGWAELEQQIADRLRDQIENLPEKQQSTLGDMDQFIQAQVNRQLESAKTRWFKSFIETDPRPLLDSLQAPTLALYGEKDSQVLADANLAEIDGLDGSIIIKTIPGANHLFQESDSGLPSEYGLLEQEFTTGVMDAIDAFLKSYGDE